jgi:hypothetical protein
MFTTFLMKLADRREINMTNVGNFDTYNNSCFQPRTDHTLPYSVKHWRRMSIA